MSYLLNWMVLILTLGAVILVALVCCRDLLRGARPREAAPAPDRARFEIAPDQEAQEAAQPAGPYLELHYRRGDATEFVQRVADGQKGYIGTESYPALGAGTAVRAAEVASRDGGFYLLNLDWQSPVRLRDPGGSETDVPMGHAVSIEDGARISLGGGWTVECRLVEAQEVTDGPPAVPHGRAGPSQGPAEDE